LPIDGLRPTSLGSTNLHCNVLLCPGRHGPGYGNSSLTHFLVCPLFGFVLADVNRFVPASMVQGKVGTFVEKQIEGLPGLRNRCLHQATAVMGSSGEIATNLNRPDGIRRVRQGTLVATLFHPFAACCQSVKLLRVHGPPYARLPF